MRASPSFLALSIALSASLLPAAAHAADTSPKPDVVETSPRWVLVGVGAGVFAVSYGVSAFVAATAQGVTDVDHSGYLWMAVPVVGPFVTAGVAPLKRDEKVTLPLLGVAQVIGLGLAAAGFVFPRTKETHAAVSAAFVPGGPLGSAGAMVVGTF